MINVPQEDWDVYLENGAILDTLIALVERGPLWDGDVPSKGARDDLIDAGFAVRVVHQQSDGYTAATYLGRDLYKWHYGRSPTLSQATKLRIARRAVNRAAHCEITIAANLACCAKCDKPVFCQEQKACEKHSDINLWD